MEGRSGRDGSPLAATSSGEAGTGLMSTAEDDLRPGVGGCDGLRAPPLYIKVMSRELGRPAGDSACAHVGSPGGSAVTPAASTSM